MLNDLIISETHTCSAETWRALFGADHECGTPHRQEAEITTLKVTAPLRKVAGGPWQSLGGYFDYSRWADRERFVELDEAIAATPYYQRYAFESDCEAA